VVFADTNNKVDITINPKKENIESFVIKEFKRTLAHELCHITRKYTYASEDHNLINSIINEGLADHFDLEMYENKPNRWSIALTNNDLDKYTKLAEKEFDNTDYDHEEWFFGTKKIPHYAGFSIGFNLVKKYFEKNPDQLPSTVFKLKAKEFIV